MYIYYLLLFFNFCEYKIECRHDYQKKERERVPVMPLLPRTVYALQTISGEIIVKFVNAVNISIFSGGDIKRYTVNSVGVANEYEQKIVESNKVVYKSARQLLPEFSDPGEYYVYDAIDPQYNIITGHSLATMMDGDSVVIRNKMSGEMIYTGLVAECNDYTFGKYIRAVSYNKKRTLKIRVKLDKYDNVIQERSYIIILE